MKTPTTAWAAGLFEGEGTVGCYGERRSLQLKVKMTDREPIAAFAALFGIHVLGPYDPGYIGKDGEPHKPVYVVQVYGPLARRVYLRLRPWLSPRRVRQGDAALVRFDSK